MNINNEIGIEKGLRDELLDNVCSKYELKKCLEKHIRQDLSLINGKLINNNDNYFKEKCFKSILVVKWLAFTLIVWIYCIFSEFKSIRCQGFIVSDLSIFTPAVPGFEVAVFTHFAIKFHYANFKIVSINSPLCK